MQRFALTIIAAAAMLAGGAAIAGEIYKWTDADGNVHYEDRPTADSPVELVNVVTRSSNNAAAQASIDARRNRESAREDAKTKKAESAKAAADERAEQQKRQQQCQMYRTRLEGFLRSQRLYREDDSGERVYLDEEQIVAALTKVEDKIRETCD